MIPESGAITSLLNATKMGHSPPITAALNNIPDRCLNDPGPATRHKLPASAAGTDSKVLRDRRNSSPKLETCHGFRSPVAYVPAAGYRLVIYRMTYRVQMDLTRK